MHGSAALPPVVLLLALLTDVAGAQETTSGAAPALNVQRFEPAPLAGGFATVHTARLLPRMRVGVDLMVQYAHRPFLRSVEDNGVLTPDADALTHLTALHAHAAFAPVPSLQFRVGAPIVQFARTGPALDTYNGVVLDTVGFGDLTWEVTARPLAEERGAGIAISVHGTAPTGTRDLYLTRGVPTVGGRFALSASPKPVHVAAYAGYLFRPSYSTVDDRLAIDDELLYGAGLGFDLYQQIVRLNLETAASTTVGPAITVVRQDKLTGRLHTAVELNANLRFQTPSGFALIVGGGAGVTPAPGNPGGRAFLGLGYAPATEPDTDGDGVPNHRDDCPKEPEDLDGFEDDDGCPEADNDQDGLPDAGDACPDDPEDLDAFEDDDGCPDPDNDRDRVADAIDRCPNEPEDQDRFQDQDGCPDPDNDGDGIPDALDACVNVAEDLDGFYDKDGCPEEEFDSDADGVIDNYDPCPSDPEDMDGWQDDDGCPDLDNDEDGLPDLTDLCPNEAEVFNGVADEDGCPDETKAVLKGDRIVILEKVLFFVNDSKIKSDSFALLDAVARTILDHPEILLLRVEGHTDSDGSDRYNLDLSTRRAQSVRTALIERGVAPDRLLSVGYGEAYPIAPNRTPEGREANRRVEFVVVQPDEPPAAPGEPAPTAPPEPTEPADPSAPPPPIDAL